MFNTVVNALQPIAIDTASHFEIHSNKVEGFRKLTMPTSCGRRKVDAPISVSPESFSNHFGFENVNHREWFSQESWRGCIPQTHNGKFPTGFVLPVGIPLYSDSRHYFLIFQHDGNLVLYKTDTMKALWSSETHNRGAAHAVFQSDGNLVIYDAHDLPLFHTGTAGNYRTSLNLNDSGKLWIVDSGGQIIWKAN